MKKILLSVLFGFAVAVCRADGPYHFIKEIPIGGDGGWDYCSVDPAGQRLYVSHGTEVVMIDLAKDQVAGVITNTPGVHGLAPAPELGRGFVSCGRENKAAIVDLKTLQILSKVDTGQNPDSMLYEPGQREAYMFNGRSQSATVIDAKTGKVVATIPLGGKPEFAQADSKAGRVFNNIEDKNEVAVIDTQIHTVVTNWPIAPGEEASGMAIDVKNRRLFLGCHNKLMVMMDSTSGKSLASVPIGDGVDADEFDPGTQLAFASCGDGTTTIAKEETPGKLTVVQTLKTQRGSRTMTLNPTTHRIYLAAAKFESSTNQVAATPRQRPRMVPGTFKILVYGMDKSSSP